jgi:hypothetical protein
MSTTPIIPGNDNIQQLGYINPDFFVTVQQAQPDTAFALSHIAEVGKTNGASELITYVSFTIPGNEYLSKRKRHHQMLRGPTPRLGRFLRRSIRSNV